jgi:hypothetical protein
MAPKQVASQRSSLPLVSDQTDGTFQASMADELASTIEHLLSVRYAAARVAEELPSRPQRIVHTITSESLMVELAAARQSRPAAPRTAEPETPRRPSPALRVFAVIGFVMIAYALLMKSPWRDQVPSIDRITQLLK